MSAARRQVVAGLVALPISVLPFLAYGTWTPEGRLLADKIEVRLSPPHLPDMTAVERQEARHAAPEYEGYVMPLVYHGIGSSGSDEGGFVVSPERFAEHLAVLKAAGMEFVTAEQVADAFAGGDPLPPQAVLVTFDDGRTDAVLWATPLLEEAYAVATMFVITGATEDAGTYYASWGQLDSDVWDLQAHTHALHRMQETGDGSLPALTSRAEGESRREWRDRVEADLDRADAELKDRTGEAPVAFAYPFGAWGAERANDPQMAEMLEAALVSRYRIGFTQDEQSAMTLAGPEVPPLRLRRLQVGDWDGMELLRQIRLATARTRVEGAR
jgi:peptidoglycan/xylan/chitin deacetylase (PgdA/CDA1 family)